MKLQNEHRSVAIKLLATITYADTNVMFVTFGT